MFQNGFGWIVVPIAGIAVIAAFFGGKVGVVGKIVVAVVVGAMLLFAPASTWSSIGATLGGWLDSLIS